MKENDVKMILSSLAYVTPIRLSFCMRTDETERERERERENFCKKKKFKIGHKPFYSQLNDKVIISCVFYHSSSFTWV